MYAEVFPGSIFFFSFFFEVKYENVRSVGIRTYFFVFKEMSTSNRWENVICRESENRVDAVIRVHLIFVDLKK